MAYLRLSQAVWIDPVCWAVPGIEIKIRISIEAKRILA
jgi:hypothetical protein